MLLLYGLCQAGVLGQASLAALYAWGHLQRSSISMMTAQQEG